MKVNLLSTMVTIDKGNFVRKVIRSWNEDLLNVDHLMHDNWVAYFKTWSRRSLFSGRAQRCRDQSNVWNSQRLLRVTLKFETKILRSDTIAQVNLISVAPTLQNLRIGLKRRQSGKSKVFFSPSENRCLPASNLKPEEREFMSTPVRQCIWSAKRTWILRKWIPWRSRVVLL